MENVILAAAAVSPATRVAFRTDLTGRRFSEAETLLLAKQDTTGLTEFIIADVKADRELKALDDLVEKKRLEEKVQKSFVEYDKRLSAVQTQLAVVGKQVPGISSTSQSSQPQVAAIVPTNTPVPLPTFPPLPTNTPVPIPTSRPGQPIQPTNTPVPLPTNTPAPTNTPFPLPTSTTIPTNTPIPRPTSPPGQPPRPTNTPVPLPTATPTPLPPPPPTTGGTIVCQQPLGTDSYINCRGRGNSADSCLQCAGSQRPSDDAIRRTQSVPGSEILQLEQQPQPPTATPFPTATPVPLACSSFRDCQSCVGSVLQCGWDGGNCRVGGSACPAGESHWFAQSCSVDACEVLPTPTPSCSVQGWSPQTCSLQGETEGSDFGGPSYCGWTDSAWSSCNLRYPKVQGASTVKIPQENLFEEFFDFLTKFGNKL